MSMSIAELEEFGEAIGRAVREARAKKMSRCDKARAIARGALREVDDIKVPEMMEQPALPKELQTLDVSVHVFRQAVSDVRSDMKSKAAASAPEIRAPKRGRRKKGGGLGDQPSDVISRSNPVSAATPLFDRRSAADHSVEGM